MRLGFDGTYVKAGLEFMRGEIYNMPEHPNSVLDANEVRADYARLIAPLLALEKKRGVWMMTGAGIGCGADGDLVPELVQNCAPAESSFK